MSSLPTKKEAEMLAQALKRAELVARNKQSARAHLLKIQLMLAKRTT
jgi:hypothetical protein